MIMLFKPLPSGPGFPTVSVQVFLGPDKQHVSHAGILVMRVEEWAALERSDAEFRFGLTSVHFAPARAKEHCPRRLMGEDLPPHVPCDAGDFSRDAAVKVKP